MSGELRFVPFVVPMRVRFRGVGERSGVLVEGPAGWGEFSPFREYPAEEAAHWLASAVHSATRPPPAASRDRIPVNTTIPAVDAARAFELASDSGCTTAKVKVAEAGQDLARDLDRVAAVRDALGPAGNIRVDANGAWDVDTAASAVGRLDAAAGGLEYVEQPCATIEELARLRRRVRVPIAADESVRARRDPSRVVAADAADVLVVKVQPMGGVASALDAVSGLQVPVVVSSAVETSVGLAAGIALAAALEELPFACGLGTATLLGADVTDDPLVPVDGCVPVREVRPDPDRLDAVAPDPATAQRLLDRLGEAARKLDPATGKTEPVRQALS